LARAGAAINRSRLVVKEGDVKVPIEVENDEIKDNETPEAEEAVEAVAEEAEEKAE
jgi:hypothetical protein